MIDKTKFATDFTLKMKEIPIESTEDEFFQGTQQNTVLGSGLTTYTLKALHGVIRDYSIVSGVLDITFDFGDTVEQMLWMDDTLRDAYAYTAYYKLFYEVLEPAMGKGTLYGVIYDGQTEGHATQPYMQISLVLEEGQETWDDALNEWSNAFKTYIEPLQQGIVDFTHVTYPEYVSEKDQWVELMSWSRDFRVLPLVDIKEM